MLSTAAMITMVEDREGDVARMGGWAGYTSRGYRPAGPKTMARGLRSLDPMVAGWNLSNRSALLDARSPHGEGKSWGVARG
jgi:hypothetical protein